MPVNGVIPVIWKPESLGAAPRGPDNSKLKSKVNLPPPVQQRGKTNGPLGARSSGAVGDQNQVFLDLSAGAQARTKLEAMPFWGDSPRSWDVVVINGLRMPGLVKVTGRIAMRKDRKVVPGTNGVRSTHLGYEPAEITFKLRMWTPDHWEAFETWLAPAVRPRPNTGAPKAYDIAHPALAVYGIKSVEFIDASLPYQSADAPDVYEVDIKALEWNSELEAKAGTVNTNKKSQDLGALGSEFKDKADAEQSRKKKKPSASNAGPT